VKPGPGIVPQLLSLDAKHADAVAAGYGRQIGPVSDDKPFFWHFSRFDDVLANIFHPIKASDPEISIGERVLLLLLFFSALYAAVFLLLPFVAVRNRWRALPAKGVSAVYFAALGLGFMFFEITMIQRLVLFLGYPTYSLTVTLAAILISTGIGALLSDRIANRSRLALPALLGVLAGLTLFYQFALGGLTDGMLSLALGARVAVAFVVLFPLGLCLGMFMPLGLGVVRRLTDHGAEYVAWSWAVNGFFSVIGAVLTTILSMQFGFRTVQFLAFGVYAVAVLALTRLRANSEQGAEDPVGVIVSPTLPSVDLLER
jgi:glucan phosphoethanolaminetransferase (alkaline phosphatase superfamily)